MADRLIVNPNMTNTVEAEALLKEVQALICGRGFVMADNPKGPGMVLAKPFPADPLRRATVVGIVHKIYPDGVLVEMLTANPAAMGRKQ